MVSVIIPVYNGEKYLEACITSVLRHMKCVFEILVIDDGSTDDTARVGRMCAARNSCIHLIQQSNAGVSVARNKGLALATGDYVMFVDADDIIIGDIDHGEYKEDLIIYNSVMLKGNRRKAYRQEIVGEVGTLSYEELVRNVILHDKLKAVWAKLYKREFLVRNAIGFEKGCIQGEDAEFNFKVVKAKPTAVYSDQCVYEYQYSSQTARHRWERFPDTMIQNEANRFFRYYTFLQDNLGKEDVQKFCDALIERRINAIYRTSLDLFCCNRATRDREKLLCEMMRALELPKKVDRKTKGYYELIINEKWALLKVVAMLREWYIKILRV